MNKKKNLFYYIKIKNKKYKKIKKIKTILRSSHDHNSHDYLFKINSIKIKIKK
jgi:hypothetical protein